MPVSSPWTEEPGGLQSVGSQRVRTRLSTSASKALATAPDEHIHFSEWWRESNVVCLNTDLSGTVCTLKNGERGKSLKEKQRKIKACTVPSAISFNAQMICESSWDRKYNSFHSWLLSHFTNLMQSYCLKMSYFLKKKKKKLDFKIPNTLFNIQWRKMMIFSYSQEQ